MDNQQPLPHLSSKGRSGKLRSWMIGLAVFCPHWRGSGWFFGRPSWHVGKSRGGSEKTASSSVRNSGREVTIPEKIERNKFGWLSAGEDDAQVISDMGGAWVRPHPGLFCGISCKSPEKGKSSTNTLIEKLITVSPANIAFGHYLAVC